MKLIRYKKGKNTYLGMLDRERVINIKRDDYRLFSCFIDLIKASRESGVSLSEFTLERLENPEEEVTFNELCEARREGLKLLSPLDPPEVWGCGVTYKRSRAAREFETRTKGVYDLVYEAERPEV
ncbi:MAG: fumarylacetoacetate hydrolase, partial [Candidatus Bathyarchaeia archaeon]